LLVVRADSTFYGAEAIATIPDDAWTTIKYPNAVYDGQLGQWVSDAEIAEVRFTAFASRGKNRAVTARLVVRRDRDANPDHVSHERPRRVVPSLAPPRRIHRLAADSRPGRGRSPPPRDHRAGHRRPDERPARAPALNVPARPVRSVRRNQLRLPANWPWATDWLDLLTAANGPPTAVPA
jgi:hypothetical protein